MYISALLITITPIPVVERASIPTSLSSRSNNFKCCGGTLISEAGFKKRQERELGRSQVDNVAKNVPMGIEITLVDGSQKSENVPIKSNVFIVKMSSVPKGLCISIKEISIQQCGDCKDNFPTRLAMLEHTKAEHINPCKICKNVFRLKS